MIGERVRLRLIAVGRMRPGPEADLFDRYAQRLRPALVVSEIPDARGTAGLLAAVPADAMLVALDEGGAAPDSVGFASLLARWSEQARPICFVIGGADGLDRVVIDRCEKILSLGPMTWPHLLVRGMLAEQLYRAQSILTGHPYHRAGRPG